MSKIVPFYAADQALVDNLCEVIEALYTIPVSQWKSATEGLTAKQWQYVEKIVGDEQIQ